MQAANDLLPEFDQYAESYEEMLQDKMRNRFARDPLHFHHRKWSLIQSLLRRAMLKPQALSWLDVGCGKGDLLDMAGPHFAQAIGCDPSEGMISRTGRYCVERQPSPTELPFGDGTFDFVTAVCVFHHVKRRARALLMGEMKRVLTPGGLCCVIEHNPWNPITRAIVRRCPLDVGAELLSAPETEELLTASGFEAAQSDYFLFLPEMIFKYVASAEWLLQKVPMGGQYAATVRRGSKV